MLRRFLCILFLLLVLAGCQGTSYSASCNNRTDNNLSRCDFTFDQLSGSFSRDINLSYIAESAASLPLELTLSVGKGTVRISYLNDKGETVSHEVTPDTPLTVSDTIQVQDKQAKLTFEAVGQTATGITAAAEVGPTS